MGEFNDPNFIPDDGYCEIISEISPLMIIKIIFDGRISTPSLVKKDFDYFSLFKNTNNKFLKLSCFEV